MISKVSKTVALLATLSLLFFLSCSESTSKVDLLSNDSEDASLQSSKDASTEKPELSEYDYCTELKIKISNVEKGSQEYNDLLKLYDGKCGTKTQTTIIDYCTGLKKKFAVVEVGSADYKKILELYKSKCD